jgi:hypothetical protein
MSNEHDNWEDTAGSLIRAVLVVIILAALAAFAGCGQAPIERAPITPVIVYDIGGFIVREFQLRDGTHCVLVANGVTCDWGHPAPTVAMPVVGDAYVTAEGQLSWTR